MMKGFRARRAPGGKRRSRLLCDHAGLFFGRVGAARGLCFGVFTARQKVRSGNFGFSLCRDFVRCAFCRPPRRSPRLEPDTAYSVATLASSGAWLMWYHDTSPGRKVVQAPWFTAGATSVVRANTAIPKRRCSTCSLAPLISAAGTARDLSRC